MTIGGAIWSIAAATAAGIAAQAAAAEADIPDVSDGPYRPASWQNAPLVTITVPGPTSSSTTGTAGSGVSSGSVDNVPGVLFTATSNRQFSNTSQTQILVFDAVIRTEHQQRIVKTEQPTQSGANISDFAYIMPARVVLEIGISDAMDSYTPGQWTGDSAKSVNAYQALKKIARDLAANGALTVTTRLDTYTNMMLMSVSAPDTAETRFSLRATIVFEEQLTGTIASQPISARSDLTGATNQGTKQPLPVPTSIIQQNQTSQNTTAPNAGDFSSNPINGS